MAKKNAEKKRARELQALGGDAVSYSTCLRLLRERGFEAAKTQVEEWKAGGSKPR